VTPGQAYDDDFEGAGGADRGGIDVPESVLAAAEAALNRYLELDPEGAAGFAPLYGRIIAIEVAGFGTRVTLIPGPDRLQLFGRYDAPADCVIRGAPLSLLRMAVSERQEQEMSSRAIQIEGDTTIAQQLARAMGGLDVDWEEQLAGVLGDPVANQVGRGLRGLRDWGRQSGDTLAADVKEYLEEEGRLIPSRYELGAFLSGVDVVRDDVERLEARLELLRGRLDGSSASPPPSVQPRARAKKATTKKAATRKSGARTGSKKGDAPE
jgi:ubiquinone biosynthesis protein UbiJ